MAFNWLSRKTLVLVPVLAAAVAVGAIIGAGGGKTDVFAAQEATGGSLKSTITVTGEGELKAAPDVAYLNVAVETRAATAKEAQAANAKQFEALKKVLFTTYKMDQKDVQTAGFYVQPEYRYNEKDGSNKVTGYLATHSVQITTRDLANIGKLFDDLSAAGANRIDGVRFDTEKKEQYEVQALDKAVANAKVKAEALAKASGRQLKGVISIAQNGSNAQPLYYDGMQMKAESAAADRAVTSVQAGQITVNAGITVIFEMQ
jgi:uncharacterized protein YggE